MKLRYEAIEYTKSTGLDSDKASFRQVQQKLDCQIQMIQNFKERSIAIESRLKNEISLVRDSKTLLVRLL